jgi:hypothetical protein
MQQMMKQMMKQMGSAQGGCGGCAVWGVLCGVGGCLANWPVERGSLGTGSLWLPCLPASGATWGIGLEAAALCVARGRCATHAVAAAWVHMGAWLCAGCWVLLVPADI